MPGIFESIAQIIQGFINSILAVIQSIFSLFESVVGQFLGLIRGLISFLLSNIVPLGLLAAAVVGYSVYQQNARGRVTKKKF